MKENELLQTTDAKVWAEEFVRLHGGDEGLMLAWFANAIMCARDHAGRQNEKHLDEIQHAIMRLPKPPVEMGDGPDERVSHVLGLLADERERVREMCARAAEGMVRSEASHYSRDIAYNRAARGCSYTIRQLDLTKDLVPSSTEEVKK